MKRSQAITRVGAIGTAIALVLGMVLSTAPKAAAVVGYTIGDPVVICGTSSVALSFHISTTQPVSLDFESAQMVSSGGVGGVFPAGPSDTHDFPASTSTTYSYNLGSAPDGPLKYQVFDLASPSTVVKSGTVQITCGVIVDLKVANPTVDCSAGQVTLAAYSPGGITYPGLTEVVVLAPDGVMVDGFAGGGDSSDLSFPIDLSQRVVDGQLVPSPVVDGQYSYRLTFNTDWDQTVGVTDGSFTVSCTPGGVTSVSPWRVLDTRTLGVKLGAGSTRSVQVTGVGGLPLSGVSAVVLNVTVTDTTSGGYLTVSPTGTVRPVVSNLNWSAGATIPNAVTVKVGTDGKVDLFQSGPGSANVIVDVAGYYMDGAVAAPGGFISLAPDRILDTRNTGGKLASAETRDLQILGAGGVPQSNVSAVVLNVTVTDTDAVGYLTVFPSGVSKPLASNLNWSPGWTIPNLVTVKVGDNGKVSLFQSGSGGANVIVDVAGYYLGGTPTQSGMFVAISPARVLDTRSTSPVPGLSALTLTILDKGGVPATGVAAVVLNTTVTDTVSAGYLTVYPGTNPLPTASNLNWSGPNTTIPNLVTTQVGLDGTIKLYNGSFGSAAVIADTAGYFLS